MGLAGRMDLAQEAEKVARDGGGGEVARVPDGGERGASAGGRGVVGGRGRRKLSLLSISCVGEGDVG